MAEARIMRVVVTLTSSESKRIIGKAVARMDTVRRAMKEGSILIATGTTNSYVAEEITGRRIDRDHFSTGIIIPQGFWMTNQAKRLPPLLIRGSEITEVKSSDLRKICDGMGRKDVFIKGANAIDHQGNAGVISVDPSGGTIGAVWNALEKKGMALIVPVGLEKTIPCSLTEVKRKLENNEVKIWKQIGLLPPSKIYLLPGDVVTEVVAFKILASVEATPIASGGIGGAEGSVTLLLEGSQDGIKEAWDITSQIKGEPPVKADPLNLG